MTLCSIVRDCREFAASLVVALTLAVAGAAGWFATAGATVAGAATSRAADLLTHAHARGRFLLSAAGPRTAGSDVIALVVAIMAVCAIVLLIVMYVRHRRGPG
jgi:hypothetical protein